MKFDGDYTYAEIPELSQEGPVHKFTNDKTPEYIFSSVEPGTLTVGGECGALNNNRVIGTGETTIKLTKPDNESELEEGEYAGCWITVKYTGTGNVSNKLHVNPFVIDRTFPTITFNEKPGEQPPDIQREPDPDTGTAIVEWAEPVMSDNRGVTFEDGPICIYGGERIGCTSSGDAFELGTTSVSYFAYDAAGNEKQVTFHIIVEVESAKAPEIAVSSSESGPVADGGTDAQGNQAFGIPKTVTYTVSNTGGAKLEVSSITTSIPVDGNVTVDPIPDDDAVFDVPANGGTGEFKVTYTPTKAGAFKFDLVVKNNDENESTYTIHVSGTGTDAGQVTIAAVSHVRDRTHTFS